jgi:LmbE family N-acetylglucosaminyl deacetylase
VRKIAVPVVAFYLFRLMAAYRSYWERQPNTYLLPLSVAINAEIAVKVEAMALYRSQFQEFFVSREDCRATLMGYSEAIQASGGALERYWLSNPAAARLGTLPRAREKHSQ